MDNFQDQMNSILQNPEMMGRIMSMAQALGGEQAEQQPPPQEQAFAMPDIDLSAIQKISGFIGQSNIDKNQRSLLNALTPYLDATRIAKLEKAMRAAKLATLASSFLSSSGLLNSGR